MRYTLFLCASALLAITVLAAPGAEGIIERNDDSPLSKRISGCPKGEWMCRPNSCCALPPPPINPCKGKTLCPTSDSTTKCCPTTSSCLASGCCPHEYVVNGQCCPPSSETCCVAGTPSRCAPGGYEFCQNNKWVPQACKPDETCSPIPVPGPNHGVYCQSSQFCDPGAESFCDGNGFRSCVNGLWSFTACPAGEFCLPFPVQGAGVACTGTG
jgi:hypothetical protein